MFYSKKLAFELSGVQKLMEVLTQNLFYIFWLGGLIVGVATVLGWTQIHRPATVKYICYLHTFGFFLMICGFSAISRYLDIYNIYTDTVIKILFFICGNGALIESRKRFPLMQKKIAKRVNQLLLEDPEKTELALKDADKIGIAQAFEKHNLDIDNK